MDPINTEVVSQTRYNLKLLGYVVIVALLAFGAFAFLNRDISSISTLDSNIVLKDTSLKEMRGVDISLPADKKLSVILNRVNQPDLLTHHEKQVILEQFSTGLLKPTDAERKKINEALNK